MVGLNFPDAAFDYVLSDQVLEHVEGNPQQAIDEGYRVLRPDGVAVHTTCFINPVHGAPRTFGALLPMHRPSASQMVKDYRGWRMGKSGRVVGSARWTAVCWRAACKVASASLARDKKRSAMADRDLDHREEVR